MMMHALTGVNALLKMFYTTKEIIGNCQKMNRLQFVNAVIYPIFLECISFCYNACRSKLLHSNIR